MGEHPIPDAAGFGLRRSASGPAATQALGEQMAERLHGGEIILLHGPLGAGKTCLVQGVCRGLDVTDDVVSPTFTLVNSYRARLTVHHLDFYRLGPEDDLDDIGIPAILDEVEEDGAVALVEWPQPLVNLLGATPRLELLVLPGPSPQERIWHLRGEPELPAPWRELFGEKDDPC